MPLTAADTCVLHVLHTNDFHGKFSDAGVARLREVAGALDGDAHILLDAGDAIKAGNIGVNPWGEVVLERMSEAGYDAMTMGNREFHVWKTAMETKINRARFPVLCANMYGKGGATVPPPVSEHTLINRGGLRVAVFGLTVPMVTPRMKAAAVSDFLFADGIETARRKVAELRWGADVVIALSHLGARADEELSRTVHGIDLIVGGHTHTTFEAPRRAEGANCPVVQAGSHGRLYGVVKIAVTSAGATVEEGGVYSL